MLVRLKEFLSLEFSSGFHVFLLRRSLMESEEELEHIECYKTSLSKQTLKVTFYETCSLHSIQLFSFSVDRKLCLLESVWLEPA